MFVRHSVAALASAAMLALGACADPATYLSREEIGKGLVLVAIEHGDATHHFKVELASTIPQQAKGLMFRTDLTPNAGMLFHPYPADGGPPKVASFWMKDTPTSLDIVFIRADGTIATIAANTTPFSEEPVGSDEPVGAVLEIVGGRAAALGIAPGDKVRWPGFPR